MSNKEKAALDCGPNAAKKESGIRYRTLIVRTKRRVVKLDVEQFGTIIGGIFGGLIFGGSILAFSIMLPLLLGVD